MPKMGRVRLVVGQMILASCIGCGSRSASVPPAPPATPPEAVYPARVETPGDASLATNLPEEASLPPDAPADPPPASSEVAAEPAESAAATVELLHESFADAAGSIRWNRDGVKSSEGPESNRTIYFFHGPPEGGPLVMRAVEDNVTIGPDEQPGVLALSWLELPPRLPYSGFTYLGGRPSEQRIILPPVQAAKAIEDLRPIRVKFRYKVVNENRTESFSLTIGCRFEPMLPDSYAKRVDLGAFTATGEWSRFDMSLADGTNAEALLAAIAGENPSSFKIVFAQAGKLADYQSGDTLLIDDIVISHDAEK